MVFINDFATKREYLHKKDKLNAGTCFEIKLKKDL